MINRSTSRNVAGKGQGPDVGKVYHLTSMCEVCERAIVPGQTWKFTSSGGKVHYYCAQQNPAPLAWPDWVDENVRAFLEAAWKAAAKTGQPSVRMLQAPKVRSLMHKHFVANLRPYDDTSLPLWLSFSPGDPGYYTILRDGMGERNPAPLGDIRTLRQGIFEHAGGRPHRASNIARAKVRNEHGVLETYTVYSNRTHNKWWLEKLVGEEPDLSEGWMSPKAMLSHRTLFYEFATSSPKKGQEWIEAVERLASGVANPAGPTYLQALAMARAAGARIGDTDGFESWLRKAKLEGRSPLVRSKLEVEFREGVDHGPEYGPSYQRVRPELGPSQTSYKGFKIWQDQGVFHVSLDPDSDFDSVQDAKRFVDAQRNPGRKGQIDWIKRFNETVRHMRIVYSPTVGWYVQDWGGPEGQARLVQKFDGDLERRWYPESWAREQLRERGQLQGVVKTTAENPFDFETGARNFGMNIGVGRSPRIQAVKARLRKAQKELAEHRAWLKSKGYDDDGVATKMERNIRWLEIALQEHAKKRRAA